jgi:glycosyltransferase involved in cell wall biosynthesis
MKEILDVFKELKSDNGFLENQFSQIHWNKNVLFVNPQLNGRHFYKYILPYIVMYEFDAWSTALTSMDKYKPNKEYESVKIKLNSKQILWADYIVLPFTCDNLKEAYESIRNINPDINIVFNVDFNYYQIGKQHPLYDKFTTEENVSNIEDNIFYSDLTLVTNGKLATFLTNKFATELNDIKYKDIYSGVQIGTIPLLIDDTLILENIELDSPKVNKDALRIGIIASNYTWEDLNSYKELFNEVQKQMGDKVKFIVLGFDGIDHFTKKSCFPEGFKFEYIKPSTIVHYFKQLRNLQLDMVFVPLRVNEFNETSENYNKFLESGLFNVPLMVYDSYPYNQLIKNGNTGILLSKKSDFKEKIEFFEQNRSELKRMGENANKFIVENLTLNEDNLTIIDDIYTLK